MKTPKLTVVGAGPGDPDLITLKAVKALEAADVVLYDALANDQLLQHARKGANIIFVGKRAGLHKYNQEEINALIVKLSRSYGHVVRLKGGDPFIFGRGQEELAYAALHGLETDYVPGISSMAGVPGMAGIPLTARGLSESFWVITGTTTRGTLSGDIQLAAQSTATVVILMGMKHIAEIMATFIASGQSQTPVAVIQNGTLGNERKVVGNVTTITDQVRAAGIGAPAIILVGQTVHALQGVEFSSALQIELPAKQTKKLA